MRLKQSIQVGSAGRPAWRSWDSAIAVLGFNSWVSFLLMPATHLAKGAPAARTIPLLIASLLALAAGIWLRQRLLLLLLFPLLLLTAALVEPQLVGPNVYSAWSALAVGVGLLAYLVATPLLLQLLDGPTIPERCTPLAGQPLHGWRTRRRLYALLAGFSIVFPALLLYGIFFHPQTTEALTTSYPGRVVESRILLGILFLLLWLGVFQAYLLRPLAAHVRGDPALRHELQQQRQLLRARQGRWPVGLLALWLAALIALALLIGKAMV